MSLANRFRGGTSSGSSFRILIILDRLTGTWRGGSDGVGVDTGAGASLTGETVVFG